MNTNSPTLTGLVIEYDSGIMPPPYSHVFRLEISLNTNPLKVSLDMHYTDREELTPEEIFDEGFTLEDDYTFKGEIDAIWSGVFAKAYQAAKWSGKSLNDAGITITPIEAGRQGKVKVPADQEAWLILAQDLIQAIYETNKKELPLTIHYRQIVNDTPQDCSITVKFSNREVLFTENGQSRTLNWDYTIQLMKVIFTPDYHYDIAKEEPGKKRGAYINCGDGYWHELGKGVENIDDSFDAVGKIRAGFEDLLG